MSRHLIRAPEEIYERPSLHSFLHKNFLYPCVREILELLLLLLAIDFFLHLSENQGWGFPVRTFFLKDVWIRTQSDAVASRRATYLATHLPTYSHPSSYWATYLPT